MFPSLESHGFTRLLAVDGRVCNTQWITYDIVDKERAELEAFVDAIVNGTKFVIAPKEVVNTVVVIEAVAASARRVSALSPPINWR
jgi:hypothetical protein